jgi:hypothetical protein
MRKILALAFTLLLIGIIPADALRLRGGGALVSGGGQTIASISLSNSSFTGGSPSGTVVGAISTTMSPASPAFSGSYSVTGTNAASFQVVGSNLETNGVVAAGSYSINIVATQAGISNSPFSSPKTITGNAQTIASVNISNTTYTPNSANAVVGTLTVTMSPSTPVSTAALTVTGANSGGFHLVGAGCANISTGTCTVETNSGGTTGSGPFTDVNFVATQASASNSPQSISPSLSGTGGAGTVVDTMTFPNIGSGTTPGSAIPKHAMLNVPPGAVPAGMIAVPTVASSAIPYQYDCAAEPSTTAFTGSIASGVLSGATVPLVIGSTVTGAGVTSGTVISAIVTAASNTYTVTPSQTVASTTITATFGGCNLWPDGSLKNAAISMFLPTLASAAAEQVTWTTTSGSLASGGLGVTPTTVAAASDYRVYATNVNTIWVNNIQMPTGIAQVGCGPTAGSLPSPGGCVIRLQAGSAGTHYGYIGNNCSTNPAVNGIPPCITASDNTVTVASTTGAPTVVTCNVTPCPLGTVSGALVVDTTTPSNIPNNTVITSSPVFSGGNTFTLSSNATITNGDTLRLLYPVNGCTNAGFYFTALDGTTSLPTGVTVPSYGTGSACAVTGSGNEKFFFNDSLNLYGSNQPPTCAAAGGSASFTGSYSSGTLTTSAVTGALSKGQIVFDSVGAHALVTAGSGSSWSVNAALTNGAMTARVPVCIYANGNGSSTSGMYGLRLYGPLVDTSTGAQDPNFERVWGYIEYWVNGSALVTTRAIAGIDNSVYLPSGTSTQVQWPSETMDLDFTNGTTPGGAGEIRGAAQGTGMWTHLTTEAPTVFYSADPALSGPIGISGTADWLGPTSGTFNLANSEAWNSVQMSRTGTDLTYWHGNHAHQPLAPAAGVAPLVINSSTVGTYYGLATYLGYYKPYDAPFMDSNSSTSWNNGGEHFFLSPDSAHGAYLYYAWADGASDLGMSWLQQLRISSLELPGQAAGIHEDVTGHALNLDYVWTTKPTALTDPVELFSHVLCNNGFDPQTTMCNNINQSGQRKTQTPPSGTANDASHWPIGNVGYITSIEGERWQVDLLALEAQDVEQTEYDDYKRVANLAGRNWYGLMQDFVGENRVMGWAPAQVSDAVQYMPGSEPEAQYQFHTIANWYDARAAWYTYTGTFSSGVNYPSPTVSTLTGTKHYDYSAQGIGTQPYDLIDQPQGQSNMSISVFEQGYEAMSMDKSVMELDHSVPSVDTVATYFIDNMIVASEAENSCIYNSLSYAPGEGVMTPQSNQQQTLPGANGLSAGWDATDLNNPQAGNMSVLGAATLELEVYNGSTLVTAVAGPGGGDGLPAQNLSAQITTTGTSPAGTTINIPAGSAANAFPKGIINDITNGTGPFFIQSIASTTITLMSSTPTTGIGSGDVLYVSRVDTYPDYPISAGNIYKSGSVVFFTAADGQEETNQDIAPHDFPVPTTPPGAVLEGKAYIWCQDPSGAWAGTINPYGTNCASPAPITFAGNKAYNAMWIVNDVCPARSIGTWNTYGDYQSPTSRLAEYWATIEGRITTVGANTARTAAETQMSPSMTPLSTTFGGGNNPRYNYDNHY